MSCRPHHDRHLTWPPSPHLISAALSSHPGPLSSNPVARPREAHERTTTSPPPDIDEDPFSHFLSPVLDDEDPFDDWSYTAGIVPHMPVSHASKKAKFQSRLADRWETFISRQHQHLQSPPRTPPSEDSLPDLLESDEEGYQTPVSLSPPQPQALLSLSDFTDGWDADRVRDAGLESQRRRLAFGKGMKLPLKRPRARSTSRTLSGKRHSWREPSEELWTVLEEVGEIESEDERLGRKKCRL